MKSIVDQLTFMSGSLARTPFRQIATAAADAGFDSITIWPNIWRHALRKDGLSLSDMRAILKDHGLALTDADACRDWVPPPSVESTKFGPQKSDYPRKEFFEICSELGGTTIVAAHLTDAGLVMDRDIEGFAKLCDDAAEFGLRIALEFVGFSNIPDVATAMKIINAAGRKNGGLVVDLGHHVRGGGSNEDLRKVPAEKVYTIQFSDGPRQPPADIVDEAMFHRQWPGDGEFDISGFLQLLSEIGAKASVGLEMYQRSFETMTPLQVTQKIMNATRSALQRAGM